MVKVPDSAHDEEPTSKRRVAFPAN